MTTREFDFVAVREGWQADVNQIKIEFGKHLGEIAIDSALRITILPTKVLSIVDDLIAKAN
jgi:hypothetical protein